jgi:hypothetical protein
MRSVPHTKCDRLHAGHASQTVTQNALVHLSDLAEPQPMPFGNSFSRTAQPLHNQSSCGGSATARPARRAKARAHRLDTGQRSAEERWLRCSSDRPIVDGLHWQRRLCRPTQRKGQRLGRSILASLGIRWGTIPCIGATGGVY